MQYLPLNIDVHKIENGYLVTFQKTTHYVRELLEVLPVVEHQMEEWDKAKAERPQLPSMQDLLGGGAS